MTIAACYVSPEGIVFGADSTSTYSENGENHYYNHAQKLFEIGEDSTFGIVTWGLGSLGVISYRMLLARLADDLKATPAQSVDDVANRWTDQFWSAYVTSLATVNAEYTVLQAKLPHDPAAPTTPNSRTEGEEARFKAIAGDHYVGFCIGGYVKADRTPKAFMIHFDITNGKPTPAQLGFDAYLWGAPNLVIRQVQGFDSRIRDDLIASGKWNGTVAELDDLLTQYALGHNITIPLREAVDFIYSCVFSTIKALKFSKMSQICGGPIEIAAITADRSFRWVRHKPLGKAITEGDA